MAGVDPSDLVDELIAQAPDKYRAAREVAARFGDGRYAANPAMARLVAVVVRMSRAAHVLELGGGAGYTGLHILGSLGFTGHLEIVETDPNAAREAEQQVERYGFSDRARVRVTDIMASVRGVNGPLDLIVSGSPARLLPDLSDDFVRLVRVGGAVLAVGPGEGDEADAEGFAAFVRNLNADDRFLVHVPESLEYALAVRTG